MNERTVGVSLFLTYYVEYTKEILINRPKSIAETVVKGRVDVERDDHWYLQLNR
jgi:hypothetical protein